MAYLDERFGGNRHYWGRLYYTENSTNKENNTSNVTLKLVMFPENSSYSFHGYNNTGTIYVDGTAVKSGSNSGYVQYGSENILCTWTGDITHNNDGSKTILVGFNINSAYAGTSTDSVYFTLTKIDRYPMLTSASNFTDEENAVVQYTTTSGFEGATYNICIALAGSNNDDISYRPISLSEGSYTFNFTNAEREILRNSTPNSKTTTAKFILRTTTAGGQNYWSEITRTLTIVNGEPTFTHTETELNTKVVNVIGSSASTVVQNASNVRITISPTALKGSSIASVNVSNGSSYSTTKTTSPYVFDVPITADTINVLVIDSRGNATAEFVQKNMIAYQSVDITSYNFERPNPTSANIDVTLEARYYPITVGSTANAPVVKWKLGEEGTYVTIPSSYYDTSETNKLKISNCQLTNVLSHEQSGTFYITLEDMFTSDAENMIVNKGIATFEAGEFDFQVNGDLIIADTDGENGVNVLDKINNLLSWTLKDNATGTASISLPSSFNEIMCIVKISNNDNVQIPLIIPYSHLTTTSQGFNGGYYGAGQGTSAYCRVVATKTSASISQAYLNVNNVTSSSTLYVYYR